MYIAPAIYAGGSMRVAKNRRNQRDQKSRDVACAGIMCRFLMLFLSYPERSGFSLRFNQTDFHPEASGRNKEKSSPTGMPMAKISSFLPHAHAGPGHIFISYYQ